MIVIIVINAQPKVNCMENIKKKYELPYMDFEHLHLYESYMFNIFQNLICLYHILIIHFSYKNKPLKIHICISNIFTYINHICSIYFKLLYVFTIYYSYTFHKKFYLKYTLSSSQYKFFKCNAFWILSIFILNYLNKYLAWYNK